MKKMNARQEKVLEFVNEFHVSKPYPAVLTDIVRRYGYDYSTVRYTVNQLAAAGYVDYIVENGRNRAIVPLWKK